MSKVDEIRAWRRNNPGCTVRDCIKAGFPRSTAYRAWNLTEPIPTEEEKEPSAFEPRAAYDISQTEEEYEASKAEAAHPARPEPAIITPTEPPTATPALVETPTATPVRQKHPGGRPPKFQGEVQRINTVIPKDMYLDLMVVAGFYGKNLTDILIEAINKMIQGDDVIQIVKAAREHRH